MKQKFDVFRVLEVKAIEIPSCREDIVIAFIRDDSSRPKLLYTWSASSRTFEYAPLSTTLNKFRTVTMSATSIPFNHSAYLVELDEKYVPRVTVINTQLTEISDPIFVHTVQVTITVQSGPD